MDKYKINYIFSRKEDINDIFIKVINKELKKYKSCAYLSLEEGRN